ncbi:hypothetical protein FGG08_001358 [Glutinoglossum americanum]|uniref:chitinase n=1 Tax=Glutinoglossum americanum TaxID=1670608 RepID=A0A9P8IDL2_9PEZI|nr:hypothetical protein FGG08_001358 [Glutinoglossum americanum]
MPVKPDGTVYLSDEWADTQIGVDGTQGCLRSLALLKQQNRYLKLILSVGGGGTGSQHFAEVAAEPMTRETFSRTARDLVVRFQLDGLDIDWEHPSDSQQGVNYIFLLDAVRRYLPAPHYILTSALPAGEWALENINLSVAHHYLDYINLMTYDFSGPWVDTCGHHAQLYSPALPHSDAARLSCDSAVTYLRNVGVPPSKIVLGIPAFGRSFLGVDRVTRKYTGHGGDEGTFEYRDLPRPEAQEHVDREAGAAFCIGGDGGFVSYDNPTTVVMKATYATQNELGGLFFWTGTADAPGPRSLVETAFKTLHNC